MRKIILFVLLLCGIIGKSQYSRYYLNNYINSFIYQNSNNSITGGILGGVMLNQNNSYMNLVSDTALQSIRLFNPYLNYTPGMGCFHGDTLYECITPTYGTWNAGNFFAVVGGSVDTGTHKSAASVYWTTALLDSTLIRSYEPLPIINICRFGADSTGQNDCSSVLKNCFALANNPLWYPTGANVFAPAGKYAIKDTAVLMPYGAIYAQIPVSERALPTDKFAFPPVIMFSCAQPGSAIFIEYAHTSKPATAMFAAATDSAYWNYFTSATIIFKNIYIQTPYNEAWNAINMGQGLIFQADHINVVSDTVSYGLNNHRLMYKYTSNVGIVMPQNYNDLTCELHSCTIAGFYAGVLLGGGSDIDNCTIQENSYGFLVPLATDGMFINNTNSIWNVCDIRSLGTGGYTPTGGFGSAHAGFNSGLNINGFNVEKSSPYPTLPNWQKHAYDISDSTETLVGSCFGYYSPYSSYGYNTPEFQFPSNYQIYMGGQVFTYATNGQCGIVEGGSPYFTASGYQAGGLNLPNVVGAGNQVTGVYNSAFGYKSAYNLAAGTGNTAVADYSLYRNVRGSSNTAIGFCSQLGINGGSYNTAVGDSTLAPPSSYSNGYGNTAVGYGAICVTPGSSNTAIGKNALLKCTGTANEALGDSALYSITSGYDNIGIGYKNDNASNTDTNEIVIGSHLIGNGSNSLTIARNVVCQAATPYLTAIGYEALYNNTTGYNNSAMGYQALYSNQGGADNDAMGYQALYSNTSGGANTALGFSALYNNASTNSNTAIGYNALYTATATANTAIGDQAMYNTTSGGSNIAIGFQCLYGNTTGGENVCMGSQNMSASTSGSDNTGVGYHALDVNTANYNSAYGWEAMYTNTSGGQNAAFGYEALQNNILGDFNSAFGALSLIGVTGSSNAGFGYEALAGTTTGDRNIGIGDSSLWNNITGNDNIGIGYKTYAAGSADTNMIVIGGYVEGQTNSITLGNKNNLFNYTTGQLISASATYTVAAGTGAGTSPTISDTATGLAIKVVLTLGTSPGAGTLFTVTFPKAFSNGSFIAESENDANNVAIQVKEGKAYFVVNTASSSLSSGETLMYTFMITGN